MILLSLLLFAPLQDLHVPAPALEDIDHAELDSVVAKYEGEDKPGFTAALCRDGEVIWSNSCGEASLEWGIPNARDTVFRLGSTSKQFTAAAVHMLAEAGTIGLDEPMVKYLPEFAELSPMPTVRQMVHHTSGLRDYLTLMSIMEYDFAGNVEFKEVLDVLLLQKGLNFAPGTDWEYSNSNYLLLAEIVKRMSGQEFATYTTENILVPLGMTDTQWLDNASRVIERRAWGYGPVEKGFERSETRLEILGDGALASTVVDLAKWAAVLVDPPEDWAPIVEAMLAGTPVTGEDGFAYGGGLEMDTFHGLTRVQHGGAFLGFRAQMAHLPDQNLTAICLANNEQFNPDAITGGLFRAALGDVLPEIEKPGKPIKTADEEETPDAREVRRALRKAQRRRATAEESARIVGAYSCSELRIQFVIELDEKGKLRTRKPDGSTSRISVRRETGEAITNGFLFGIPVSLEFDAKGRLLGGTLDAGRAKGMRFDRRVDETSAKTATED